MTDTNDAAIAAPRAEAAENSVLAAVLLDASVLDDVAPILAPDDFFIENNQVLYRAMLDLHAKKSVIDPVTIGNALEHSPCFPQGVNLYLSTVMDSLLSTPYQLEHARLVREKSVLRSLLKLASNTMLRASGGDVDSDGLLNELHQSVSKLAVKRGDADTVTFDDTLEEVYDEIANFLEGSAKAGLKTGYVDLDRQLGGLDGGQFVVMAARPSVGKSALALDIARNVAITGGKVLFFSLEMKPRDLAKRLVYGDSGVAPWKVKTGAIDQHDRDVLVATLEAHRGRHITFSKRHDVSALDIRSLALREKRERGLDLLVIDYLGLIRTASGAKHRVNDMGEISRALRLLALELDIPVLCLAQLNRQNEAREDKTPHMSDIRETGQIENDADIVMVLHRPDYYKTSEEQAQNPKSVVEVHIKKNRSGPTGKVELLFDRRAMKFDSIDPYHQAA